MGNELPISDMASASSWRALVQAMDAACPQGARIRSFAAGECVFRAGDAVRYLFVVTDGQVRLVRHSLGGVEITVHTARAGSGLAEASLFASRYHCDALADVQSVIAGYPKAALLAAWRTDQCFAMALTTHLATQVHALRGRIELLNEPSAPQRLLAFLRSCPCDDDGAVVVAGTWKHIAGEIGLTHEAVYRALRFLEREGYIERRSTRCVRLLESGVVRSP